MDKRMARVCLSGRCLELLLHERVDEDDNFAHSYDTDMLILVDNREIPNKLPSPSYTSMVMFEAELKNRHHGLVGLGQAGLAVAVAVVDRGIGRAVWTFDAVVEDLGYELSDALEIHRIPPHLQPLALAILRGTGRQAMWKALTQRSKSDLLGMCAVRCAFFNRERLVGCM